MKITKGLWNDVKQNNIAIIGGFQKEKREKPEKFYEEMMAENFLHLGKETVIQITSPTELQIR